MIERGHEIMSRRLHKHAQEEIRVSSQAIYEITKSLFPRACDRFEEYVLHGVRLSRTEIAQLRALLTCEGPALSTADFPSMLGALYQKLTG